MQGALFQVGKGTFFFLAPMFSSSSEPGTSPMPIRGRIELDVVLESEITGNKKIVLV